MNMVCALALTAFGFFWAGWAAGSWKTGEKDLRLVMQLVRLEVKETEAVPPAAPPKKAEIREEELRLAEEDARIQALLDNIEAYGTNKPQIDIEVRSDR